LLQYAIVGIAKDVTYRLRVYELHSLQVLHMQMKDILQEREKQYDLGKIDREVEELQERIVALQTARQYKETKRGYDSLSDDDNEDDYEDD
jgi:hypothetical protein